MLRNPPNLPNSLLVACFCAQWCGVCRTYATTYAEIAAKTRLHTNGNSCVSTPERDIRFFWVDVEEHADFINVEIDNFPTLLVAHNGIVSFFGTVTPFASHLQALIDNTNGNFGTNTVLSDGFTTESVTCLLSTLMQMPSVD